MNIASKAAWGLGSVGVVALAAAWWLTVPPSPEATGGDEREQTEAVAEIEAEQARTAVAYIAAESARGSVAPGPQERIEAPPGFVPA